MTELEAEAVGRALDALALALTDHGHRWPDDLRSHYEKAIEIAKAYGGCTDSDSSASGRYPPHEPSTEHRPLAAQA